MTGTLFSSDSRRMRAAISADCTGEPPGELISMATAAGLPRLNALSIIAAVPASSRPRPPAPMAPCRRMTETTGPLGRNGSQFIMADI